jgi:hypothetical protein
MLYEVPDLRTYLAPFKIYPSIDYSGAPLFHHMEHVQNHPRIPNVISSHLHP